MMHSRSSSSRQLGRPVDSNARTARTVHILNAARRCFARKGFHAASMAEIGTEAGVSPASLYQYFANKDDLMMALIQDNLQADLKIIRAFESAGSFEEGLKSACGWMATANKEGEQHTIRLDILAETFRRTDVADAVRHAETEMIDLLATVIEDARTRGEVGTRISSREAAALIVAFTDGILSHTALSPVPPDQIAAAFFQFVVEALGLPSGKVPRNTLTAEKRNRRR